MADEQDPFEAELASFRPQPISMEVRDRIGAELTRGPMRWVATLAGLAAAACIVVGAALWLKQPKVVTKPVDPTVPVRTADVSPMTLMDYQRAIAKSSDSLDALFARPAGRDPRSDDRSAERVRAFSRSFNERTYSNGD